MESILTLLALALLTFSGVGVLGFFDRTHQMTWMEKLSLGYGLGIGVLTVSGLFLQTLHVPFSRGIFVAILVSTGGLLFFKSARHHQATPGRPPFNLLQIGILIGLLIIVLFTFFQAWIKPMEAFDAAGIWGYKAKQIFQNQGIPVSELSNVRYPIYHADYPLLAPLAQAFIYFWLGHFNDFSAKLIFPGYFLATLTFFYASIGRLMPDRTPRLLLTLMLATVPFLAAQATTGYVDLIVAYYFFCATALLYVWLKTRNPFLIILSSLNAGFACLTKNEGVLLALVLTITFSVAWFKHEWADFRLSRLWVPFFFWVSLLGVCLPWLQVRHEIHFANDLMNAKTAAQITFDKLYRIGPILWHYQKTIFSLRNWNLSWILFLVAVFRRPRYWLSQDVFYILLPMGLGIFGYSFVFLITTYDLQWHLNTAATRLFLHFLPLAIYFLAEAWRLECGSKLSTSGE
jgi:hypothetical protein